MLYRGSKNCKVTLCFLMKLKKQDGCGRDEFGYGADSVDGMNNKANSVTDFQRGCIREGQENGSDKCENYT